MQRRAVLASASALFAGGCIGGSDDDADEDETLTERTEPRTFETFEPWQDEEPAGVDEDRDHYVSGMWMNNVPEEANPYPTDEEPLKSNEVLQEFFDATASQDKYEGSEERKNNGEGELVHKQVTAEEMEQIVEDIRAVEYNDEGFRRGRYADHDGTYIWFTVESK